MDGIPDPPRESWAAWLDTEVEPTALQQLLIPDESDQLQAEPISMTVDNVRNEGPEVLA